MLLWAWGTMGAKCGLKFLQQASTKRVLPTAWEQCLLYCWSDILAVGTLPHVGRQLSIWTDRFNYNTESVLLYPLDRPLGWALDLTKNEENLQSSLPWQRRTTASWPGAKQFGALQGQNNDGSLGSGCSVRLPRFIIGEPFERSFQRHSSRSWEQCMTKVFKRNYGFGSVAGWVIRLDSGKFGVVCSKRYLLHRCANGSSAQIQKLF